MEGGSCGGYCCGDTGDERSSRSIEPITNQWLDSYAETYIVYRDLILMCFGAVEWDFLAPSGSSARCRFLTTVPQCIRYNNSTQNKTILSDSSRLPSYL